MVADSRTDADTTFLETHQVTLETENITFVDDLNDEISAILEETVASGTTTCWGRLRLRYLR